LAIDEAVRSIPTKAASSVILVIVSSSISLSPGAARVLLCAIRGNYENAGNAGLFNKAKRRAAQQFVGLARVPFARDLKNSRWPEQPTR